MRFSATAAFTFAMVSLALALPMDATVAERNIVAREVLTVYSDTGSASIDIKKRDATETEVEEPIETYVSDGYEESAVLDKRVTIGDASNAVAIVNGIINIALSVDKFVGGLLAGDIERRQQFTQRTVGGLRQKFPGTNFVMSNVGYSFTGHMISRKQVFYHNHVGAKVSYDVIAFKHGTFQLQGDGGFQNWAAIYDSSCQHNGGHISC